MLDFLISGGMVVDGTGAAPRRADVGIQGDRIVSLGSSVVTERAHRTIDATGLTVCPGFIDLHTHYDAQLGWDPAATPSLFHGVTTVIGGNCGFTIAPLGGTESDYLMRMMARVEGMPLEALEHGLNWDWKSFGDWLGRFEGRLGVNAGFLVGHSAIRRVAMGERAIAEVARSEDISRMTGLLHDALDAGGLGFSTSRAPTHNDAEGNPVPSRWAQREEFLTLASVVREHAGTTALELLPGVGAFSDDDIDFMSALSLAACRPVNWNVLGATKEGTHLRQLEASDRAAERGGRVVALTLPEMQRPRLSLRTGFVFDALPGWKEVTSRPLPDRMQALADPEVRVRLRRGAESPAAGPIARLAADWPSMEIAETFSLANEGLVGRTIGDVARERGTDPFDTFLDVALADQLCTGILPPKMGDDDESWRLRGQLWHDERTVLGGSDAGAHVDMQCGATYTTALLGYGVRERQLISLAEAVRQLSEVPARFYGLRGRGRLEENWYADVVVFDAERVAPEPLQTRHDLPGGAERLYAEAAGVEHVLINGTEVVDGGALTGAQPGTLLRSGRDSETVLL
jgi:N-acyl-D-aspartate/D-glutamate deacylase